MANAVLQIQTLLERSSGVMRNNTREIMMNLGLQPVHVEVLNYLQICNEFSNTPLAVADYLGQTKGTVSQSLKTLHQKGFIDKSADAKDKRISHLRLTEQGQAALQQLLPAKVLSDALAQWQPAEQIVLQQQLQRLLRSMIQANGNMAFGQCKDCQHNQQQEAGYFCALVQQPLATSAIELICKEFSQVDSR